MGKSRRLNIETMSIIGNMTKSIVRSVGSKFCRRSSATAKTQARFRSVTTISKKLDSAQSDVPESDRREYPGQNQSLKLLAGGNCYDSRTAKSKNQRDTG